MFEKELTELLKSEGAALAGFCSLESAPGAPFPFAVSVVVKLSDSILKTIDNAPTMPYFQHYRAVNYKLDSLALSAVKFIEDRGYARFRSPRRKACRNMPVIFRTRRPPCCPGWDI